LFENIPCIQIIIFNFKYLIFNTLLDIQQALIKTN